MIKALLLPVRLVMMGNNSKPKLLLKQTKTINALDDIDQAWASLLVRLSRTSSKEAAAMTSPGRLFHSGTVRGKKVL